MTSPRPNADRYPFEPGSLTTASAAADLFARYPAYDDTLTWLREEVGRPNALLGRRGAICPRIPPALRDDVVWLVTIPTTRSTPAEAIEKGAYLADLFDELSGGAGNAGDTSLVAVFPEVPAAEAADFIDVGHATLRPDFIARGMMLGEFHPTSNGTSAHNPALPVMRSPWPSFVVRAMTPHDLMFLEHPRLPAHLRLPYLQHFAEHVSPRLNQDELVRLDRAIDAARTAVESTPSS